MGFKETWAKTKPVLKGEFKNASLAKKVGIVGGGVTAAVLFHPYIIGGVVTGAVGSAIGYGVAANHDKRKAKNKKLGL